MKRLLLLLPLLGCDEIISVRNQAPTVIVTGYCSTASDGATFIMLEVTDLEDDPVDVDLVTNLGGIRTVLGSGSTGDGDRGLTSDAQGVEHAIEWSRPCASATCADPCADREIGPSGLTACAATPDSLPDLLSVVVFATDGNSVNQASFDVPRMVGCP